MSETGKSLQISLTDPYVRSLACAAITPGLRSILLLDTALEVLQLSAEIMVQMLAEVVDKPIKVIHLHSFENEENLWGSWQLAGKAEEQILQWKSGLLVNDSQLLVVVIHDLTKLSLAATRACVVLMGADVADLERYGKEQQWQPNICWLARCATQEIGMVSPHLLDRFALRLKGKLSKTDERFKEILTLIDNEELVTANKSDVVALPEEIKNNLKQALQHHPQINNEALARILDYTPETEIYHRREITLARLALANLRLEGGEEMRANHVDAVAEMMGLKPINKQPEPQAPIPSPIEPQPKTKSEPQRKTESTTSKITQSLTEPLYPPDKQATLESIPVLTAAAVNPYPEDEVLVEREVDSLRFPSQSFHSKVLGRGVIIGVEKTKNFQDIAIVTTLLEAAKYQQVRPKNPDYQQRNTLRLSPTDFYSYRRSPVAEQMLMVIIDYTCLKECDWQEQLLPFLSWAYVERASVCLIQVGAANASNYLQAERITAQNILVPAINDGLEAKPGKATPLAHGLDLGLQTLRHALQHGRSTIQQAVLVVITDARGNVPLIVSRYGQIEKSASVGSRGVDDALSIAKRIQSLDRVKAVVMNPQPKQYKNLPVKLAQEMGASIIDIPPLAKQEAD